jgi:hypothetical protein
VKTSPPVSAIGTYLDVDPERFRDDFDRRSFAFRHRLAGSPLFEPHRLLAIAREMAADPRDVYYDAGDIEVGQRWDQIPACDLTVEQLMHRIETANAWIVLRKVDKSPDYAELLDRCIAEIESQLGRSLRDLIKIRNALIFITSPHRITTYHIDRECSWLLQIRGTKTIRIFDPRDRDVLPEEELERFWTVDNNAPTYRPHLEHRAAVYELTPGMAVHLPVNAPHWVQNGPQVSVSLNINFHYKDRELADIYRANHWLRRLGFKPRPPRQSALLDGVKRTVYGSARPLRTFGRSLRGKLAR